MPNYLNLKKDEAICPVCGKILTGHKKRYCGYTTDEEGDACSTWWDYYTFECKDCKVKASTKDYKLHELDAWTIPSEHLKNVNITQKQINYLKFLYGRLEDLRYEECPIILNTNVMRDYISQVYDLYVKQTIKGLSRERFLKCFEDVGYNSWSDRWDEDCYCHKNYKDMSVTIYYDKETLTPGKMEYVIRQNFKEDLDVDTLIQIQNDLCEIKQSLILLKDSYVTRDDAIKQIDHNKEEYINFKKNYSEYERDYYDGIDDFPVENQ